MSVNTRKVRLNVVRLSTGLFGRRRAGGRLASELLLTLIGGVLIDGMGAAYVTWIPQAFLESSIWCGLPDRLQITSRRVVAPAGGFQFNPTERSRVASCDLGRYTPSSQFLGV